MYSNSIYLERIKTSLSMHWFQNKGLDSQIDNILIHPYNFKISSFGGFVAGGRQFLLESIQVAQITLRKMESDNNGLC